MGIAERKQREKEIRLAEIKKSAASVFQKKGYATATVDEIARLCEISKTQIYQYFKSKDDLLYSILEPEIARLTERIGILVKNGKEPASETIRKIFTVSYEHYDQNPDVYQMLWQHNIHALPDHKLNRLEHMLRENTHHMETAIKKGIDQGLFREVDPKLAAIVVWSLYMGVYHHQAKRMLGRKTDYRKSTIDAALELILQGLKRK
ncbi:MAG: TetR/AcrR family transcriptional regulator [Deltaproteobacteria bacterium]|nr:TetR/AcrR family transcriptional regulator [Deltaproteobacteria bacterium]